MKKLIYLILFLNLSLSIVCNLDTDKEAVSQEYKILQDKYYFQINTVQYEIERNDNVYNLKGYSIPSDLINLMTQGLSFEIVINQGRLPKAYKEKYYFKNKNSHTPGDLYFFDDNILIDNPSGYLFHSNNFSPLNNFPKFKNFFDIFTNIFKLTLNPILDRSSHIQSKNKDRNDNFFFDNTEKACTDHLDAIKDTLPSKYWSEFIDKINYDLFAIADYKSIKYFLSVINNKIKFGFKIIYKVERASIINKIEKKSNFIEKENVYFDNKRYMIGDIFNINNFEFKNEIIVTESMLNSLQVIDVIPDQLNILLSTIKVDFSFNNTLFFFNQLNLSHIFDIKIIEGIEEQNPIVPFTYENKKSLKFYFNLKENFLENYLPLKDIKRDNKITITISYQLRKRILNFESYENESEYGYKFPCGLIIINYIPIPTNHIYFNMPNIDGTMPFNVIALTWVVFGFIFIQILNMFLKGKRGDKDKSIWQTIKDRFIAKWGFLFGR